MSPTVDKATLNKLRANRPSHPTRTMSSADDLKSIILRIYTFL